MYRLQKLEVTQQYQQLTDRYYPILKLVEDVTFEYDQVKSKAREIGFTEERV